jgi:hypothetical protein
MDFWRGMILKTSTNYSGFINPQQCGIRNCIGVPRPLQGNVGATDRYGTGDRVGELGVCNLTRALSPEEGSFGGANIYSSTYKPNYSAAILAFQPKLFTKQLLRFNDSKYPTMYSK